MGTLNLRQKFDPYDLELIDRVYGLPARISRHATSTETRRRMRKNKTRSAKLCSPVQAPARLISTTSTTECWRAWTTIGPAPNTAPSRLDA